jgi:hypothetical protein
VRCFRRQVQDQGAVYQPAAGVVKVIAWNGQSNRLNSLERVHPPTGTDKGAKSASLDALIGAAIYHNRTFRDEAITILEERLQIAKGSEQEPHETLSYETRFGV